MSLSYNTIAVFAGSDSYGLEHEVQRFGDAMGRRSVEIVCNGSGKGLAEEFFSSANSQGGKITKLVSPELAGRHYGFRENLSVLGLEGAAARKREMIARSEAILVLPGGVVGDADDSVLTPKDLANGAGEKPIIIVNLGGHFKGLRDVVAQTPARNVQWAGCIDEALDMLDHMRMNPPA